MRSYVAGLLGLGACYSPSIQTGSPCPDGVCPHGLVCSELTKTCESEDALIDAAVDARPDQLPNNCYGVGLLIICPNNSVTGNTSIAISGTQTLDTSTSTMCESYHLLNKPNSTEYCLLAAKTVTVLGGAKWNITGTRPLVVIATNAMTIDGTIDVASHRGGLSGPGSNPAACIAGGSPMSLDGGPGGSFGTKGGTGGGAVADPPVTSGPVAGTITTLRGGCGGRAGGGTNAGAAGRGGGAVYLIADNLLVSGTINASGASGTGAGLDAGGGGGGSGGMIGLDAPTLTVTAAAKIFANGGGGGEGGGGSNGGNSGTDPVAPATPSPGGGGNAGAGGDAGDGAINALTGDPGDLGTTSGGGGGGGVGVIKVFPMKTLGGAVSPPPS